jgi:hypothetical protein
MGFTNWLIIYEAVTVDDFPVDPLLCPNFPAKKVPTDSRLIRVARFFLIKHTKTGKNIPNGHKIYPRAIKYAKWP